MTLDRVGNVLEGPRARSVVYHDTVLVGVLVCCYCCWKTSHC